MKYIIQIAVVMMVMCGSAHGQEKSDCLMNISIWDKSPKQNIILTITSPEGKEVWNADSKTNKVLDSNTNFIEIKANNWYSLPGEYKINIELSDKYSEYIVYSSLNFAMNGKEINLSTIIYLPRSAEQSKLSNAFFYIEKNSYSSDSVLLIERWKPSPNGEPTYTIVNNSTIKIKGTSWQNNYFGNIMKYADGKWNILFRGGFCGTVGSGEILSPGDTATTIEGYFIGKPKIFTQGRYKYCVEYIPSDCNYELSRSHFDRTHNNILEIYLLEKEFTIEE